MYKDIRSAEKILTMIFNEKTAAGVLDGAAIVKDALESIKVVEKAYVLACRFIAESLFCPAVDADAVFPECNGEPDECGYETWECWQRYFLKFAVYKPDNCLTCQFFNSRFNGDFCKIFDPRYFLDKDHVKKFEKWISSKRAIGCPLDNDFLIERVEKKCHTCGSTSQLKKDETNGLYYCKLCRDYFSGDD